MWTFVPVSNLKPMTSVESPSAPDMGASISACTSPNPAIALSVTSSGKPTLRPLSWHGWRTRPWVKLLSGTTCDPSTVALGAAAFISSLPVIHASPSAMPVAEEVRVTRVTFGPRSPASPAKSNRNGSSAKTSRDTCPWATPTSKPAFAAWATRQRRASSQREKQAQATGVAGYSSWPTPTASDGGYVPDLVLKDGSLSMTGPFDCATGSGGQFSTGEATRSWTSLWLAMRAIGWTPTQAQFRSSHPVRVSFRLGTGSLHSTLISNPRFYEMAMGWPIGWSAPGAPVTGYVQWLRRSRGRFSRLLTSWTPDPA